MYNKYGKRKWWILFLPLMIAAVFLFGWIVMLLWNSVLVPAAHFNPLSLWQGIGLLLLSKILFGSFRGRPGGFRGGSPQWKQKWMNMSDEEKLKFRDEWKKRCGPKE